MAKGKTAAGEANNVVSEWFGHRVYPVVSTAPNALDDQQHGRCPFLTQVVGEEKACIKSTKSKGVCNISSKSNGTAQDWLVCPYRALDTKMVHAVAHRLFSVPSSVEVVVRAAPTLERESVRKEITAAMTAGKTAVVYMQDKLGGEISLSSTKKSPELSFDITLVELTGAPEKPTVGRYAIMEVQTMDFHGTYQHVVSNLTDALRLHGASFPAELQAHPQWLSKEIEGPNVANVFKRTFYQMAMKFQLGGHGQCAGTALAIPQSVWDSWQRHLGAPELQPGPDGTYKLYRPEHDVALARTPAWIYVFDVDATAAGSPSPIQITRVIATDADSLAYFALKVAPEAALEQGGSADLLFDSIRTRLAQWWPELGPVKPGTRIRDKAGKKPAKAT